MPKRTRTKETSNPSDEENAGTNSKNKKMLVLGAVLGALAVASWDNLIKARPQQVAIRTAATRDYKPIYNIPDQDLRTTIRKWGCNRTETPFIFVHIGKAGGGSVRSKFSASSLNYSQEVEWQKNFGAYYPVSATEKARFCNSCFSSHRPSSEKSFEGSVWCHATTPIGHAIACPESLFKYQKGPSKHDGHKECSPNRDTCHLVYVGHNWLGAEMHWLPHKYLRNWWNNLQHPTPAIPWHRLDPSQFWCQEMKRPATGREHNRFYESCSIPIAREVDALASVALSPDGIIHSWAPLYASLPVLRVTILRDPFTWLMSQFFWRHSYQKSLTCDNVVEALGVNESSPFAATVDVPRRQVYQLLDKEAPGWLPTFCFRYIFYLCGEDCATRYSSGRATLADLEQQAEENLRHSFAVVGILEEGMDDFYGMVDARVQYIDTKLEKTLQEQQHQTSTQGEALRCKERYLEPAFQEELLKKSPELSALKRLYEVGKEVKKFQKEELQQCIPA